MPQNGAEDVSFEVTQRFMRSAWVKKKRTDAAVEWKEDIWLNDLATSAPESRPDQQDERVTLPEHGGARRFQIPILAPAPTASPAIERTPFSPRTSRIGRGHPLWPVVLYLSERVWQQFFQELETGRAPLTEEEMADSVRKSTLDLLVKELNVAEQIRGIAEAEEVFRSVELEVLGYGPLEALLDNEAITSITVVGPHCIFVERDGEVVDVDPAICSFENEQHMRRVLANMLREAGESLAPSRQVIELRLPAGLRVNAILPPLAREVTISIRMGIRKRYSLEELVQHDTLSQPMADFLHACVQARLNIVICGEGASGRTTLLNALAVCIPPAERVFTVEDTAELQLPHKHLVSLFTRWAAVDSSERLTKRDLVASVLRMQPGRLVLDECQSDEAREILRALNNGGSGLLLTLYATNVRHCLSRFEMLCQEAEAMEPAAVLRAQIASTLDVLIYLSRQQDGAYKITNIAEAQGVQNDTIKLQSLFHYQATGLDRRTGKAHGTFEPSGFCPSFLPRFKTLSIPISAEMFMTRSPAQ